MRVLLIVRDSDGAILGSQRAPRGSAPGDPVQFANQDPAAEHGPFGDRPFADASTLAAGYSGHEVTVPRGTPPPRGETHRWDGSAAVPVTDAVQGAWWDASDPQRIKDRRRARAIVWMQANPTASVPASRVLQLIGEAD